MSNYTMNYVWRDYNPKTMRYIESWLDESAIKSTGLDEGFCGFYEYWASEDGFVVGENFGARSHLKTISLLLLLPFVSTNTK